MGLWSEGGWLTERSPRDGPSGTNSHAGRLLSRVTDEPFVVASLNAPGSRLVRSSAQGVRDTVLRYPNQARQAIPSRQWRRKSRETLAGFVFQRLCKLISFEACAIHKDSKC